MKGKEWENYAGKKKQKSISYNVDGIFGYIKMCSVGILPENAKFKQS